MFKIFVFEEGIEIGAETVSAEDLDLVRNYYTSQGYLTEVEKLS